MPSIRQVEETIGTVEGFEVRFLASDGSDPARRRVDDYPYVNAANRTWTVAKWRRARFTPTYEQFDVEVLDGEGGPVHGKTLLTNLRASYFEAQEEDSDEHESPSPARSTSQAPALGNRHSDQKPIESLPTNAVSVRQKIRDEPLGFEDTLWKAADKLRGSMDSSEYKHVVLGLVFLKYVDDAFGERRAQLAADLAADDITGEQADELLESRDEYTAEGVFWVPPEARWAYLAGQCQAARDREAHRCCHGRCHEGREPDVCVAFFPRTSPVRAWMSAVSASWSTSSQDSDLAVPSTRRRTSSAGFTSTSSGASPPAEGKGGGEFYTPRNVVKLLVEMIEPYKGRVYDPSCGSGGMFVQSEQFVESPRGMAATTSLSTARS